MTNPTYPDGFPKSALEAIEFSYFLSENEKSEWREWLQSAAPDQHDELIDILHSMWKDNQKNAVPESFANNLNQNQPNPQFPTQNQTGFSPNNNPSQFPPNPSPAPAPSQNPFPSFEPNNSFAGNSQFPQSTQPQQPEPTNFQPTSAPTQPAPSAPPTAPAPTNPFPSQNQTPPGTPTPDFQDFGTPAPAFPAPTENPKPINTFEPQGNPSSFNQFQSQPDPIQPQNFNQNFNPQTANDNTSPAPQSVQTPAPEPIFEPKPAPTTSTPPVNQNQPTPLPVASEKPAEPTTSKQDPKPQTPEPKAFVPAVEPPKNPAPKPAFDFDEPDSRENQDSNPEFDETSDPTPASKNGEINMESLVNDNKYRRNPLLDNPEDQEDGEDWDKSRSEPRFTEKNKPSKRSNSANKNPANRTQSRNNNDSLKLDLNFEPKNNQAPRNSGPQANSQNSRRNDSQNQNAVNFSNLKEASTGDLLDEIYQDYISTYDTNQKKFLVFLERITRVLGNYENITEHFKEMTSRVLDLNDKTITQAKDIQRLKDVTQSQSDTSLQDQIDDLRYDLENIDKEVRQVRTESRRRMGEMSQQLAAAGMDTYKDGGLLQRVEILTSELKQIQGQINLNNSGQGNPKANNQNNQAGQNPQNTPTRKSSLDLSGIL